MARKKTGQGVTPSVNPTPKIEAASSEELKGLGIRQVERHISNKPVIVGNEGGRKLMAFKNVVETHTSVQPHLNQVEVEKLGIRGWWPYRGGDWTTIAHGRRFKLSKEIFEDMKNRGLVLAVSVKEAGQWRNK